MPTPDNPSNAWSAAAWIGAKRSDSAVWVDTKGAPLNYVPWCPGEPNFSNGIEGCASMLTLCTPGASTALVNDYDCSRPLRVLCAYEASAGDGCSELLNPVLEMRCPACLVHCSRCANKRPAQPSPSCQTAGSDPTLSTCAGGMELMLHTQQALTQPAALQFCKQQHGAGAVLPPASQEIMSAAKLLVQRAQVGPVVACFVEHFERC